MVTKSSNQNFFMKQLFGIMILLFVQNYLSAQDTLTWNTSERTLNKNLQGIVSVHRDSAKLISRQAFNRKMNEYLSLAITGRQKTTIGTVASLSVSNNETKLAIGYTAQLKKILVTAGTTINIKDNTGVLFADNTMQPGVNGNFKISVPSVKKIKYGADESVTAFTSKKEKQAASLINAYRLSLYELKKTNDRLAALSLIPDAEHQRTNAAWHDYLREKEELEKTADRLNKAGYPAALAAALLDSMYNFEMKEAPVTSTSFTLFSFAASYGREQHQLFDGTKAASLFTEDHDRFKLGLEALAFFDRKTPSWLGRTKIFSAGIDIIHDNNIASFKAAKVPVVLLTANNDTIRTKEVVEKPVVFDVTNALFRQYFTLSVNLRYAAYYTEKRTFGWSIFGNASGNKYQQGPLLNLGVGLIGNVPGAEDNKTVISFELYYKLVDVTQRMPGAKGRFHERNEIGFTTAVPLSKLVLR
jgi:hypothetical protein